MHTYMHPKIKIRTNKRPTDQKILRPNEQLRTNKKSHAQDLLNSAFHFSHGSFPGHIYKLDGKIQKLMYRNVKSIKVLAQKYEDNSVLNPAHYPTR